MDDGFWEMQEEFESRMGWNTEERIAESDEPEQTRLEELNFSLYRAFAETAEMYHEATGISLDGSRGNEISDEQYDNLGYEAVDILLFLKKAGETLNQDLEGYLRNERRERYDETGDSLEELLEPGLEPEVPGEDHRADEIKSRASDIVEEIGPQEFDVDNLYNQFREIYTSCDYSSDRRLGEKLASTMLDVVEMMGYLPRDASRYFREKQEENRERLESGEDFGEGSQGYGETPDWILKPKEEGTEPAYVNMLS
jgi:hypothetical protein